MPRGGKRPNSGPPKGTKYGPNKATLSKEAAREVIRQVIMRHADEMTAAQIANSKGLKYLVTRDKKTGKFVRVTEAMARLKQGDSEEIIEVWEKDPSVQAYTDLMNRYLGKPTEEIELRGKDGSPLVVKWQD